MRTRTVGLLLATVAVGCGESPAPEPASTVTTSPTSGTVHTQASSPTTTQAIRPSGPLPTVADVNRWWATILDPDAPLAQRAAHFADTEADPQFADKFAKGARAHDLSVTTHTIREVPGGAAADAVIELDGSRTPDGGSVLLTYADGNWRVDRKWSCAMLPTLGENSIAC